MKEKIAVIGANEPLIPFYRQAKALGYEIIGIAIEKGAVCKKYCDRFYPVSFADKDQVVEVCRKEKVDGIISFSLESALPTVAYVASKLGLVSNSEESIKLTQSKFAQRQALEKAGIPVPKYYLIENVSDLEKIQCRYPVIVKPVDSGGSQGICKVENPEKLVEAYKYAIDYSRTSKAIVEEFVDGREFSVEYISHKGQHFFLQITDKVTSGAPRFVEMQHHQPADIPESVWKRIQQMVEGALTALKIENSASHTEIKWNSRDELFIIETGARMGGDYISSDLVRLSTGYDFVEGAIKLAVNKFEKPSFPKRMNSGVYFYSKLAAEVGEIIKKHEKWPEIVEWGYSNEPLMEVKSNADRRGYFLYQKSSGKLDFVLDNSKGSNVFNLDIMPIESRWASWEDLLPYKEQLIDMEIELMVRYHYPDRIIPRSYPEQRVNSLQEYLQSGSTYIWISTYKDRLLGYYWAYVSTFIDKKRWNLRSLMFLEEVKGLGLGDLAINEGLNKARELGCDEAATEYVPWNTTMEKIMEKNGYKVKRIEVVKELKK